MGDTGIGIAPAALPHLFERFYRGDPTQLTALGEQPGSGLGLSIAKSLVAAHGGTLAVDSHLGRGTTVTVTLISADVGDRMPREAPRSDLATR